MFCECGTYLPNGLRCPACNQIGKKEAFITEKFYTIHHRSKKDDRGAKISEICPKCGNEEMYYRAVQLRSADEGQTIFYECDCGYKFTLHS